jgi:multisubunit Na+/H+ antiporter MnhG subunit
MTVRKNGIYLLVAAAAVIVAAIVLAQFGYTTKLSVAVVVVVGVVAPVIATILIRLSLSAGRRHGDVTSEVGGEQP